MKVYLIRHGKTPGNLEKRYVGKTDEGLCEGEKIRLRAIPYPKVDKVFSSSMKRCRETARIIYPDQAMIIVKHLHECDFGEFEYKNYEELKENLSYQKFIDTMGESGFPGGEKVSEFKKRCRATFYQEIREYQQEEMVAFVIHGGTIMSILEAFSSPHKDYYDWQLCNGECYEADVSWGEAGKLYLKNIKKSDFSSSKQ